MSNAIYMDANATTPPCASAQAAVEAALRTAGNPSSVHRFGRGARALVDRARIQVAQLVGAKAENVIFVSSGTEANNLALASRGDRPLIVSGIEHDSVLKPAQLAGARILQVQRNGVINVCADSAVGEKCSQFIAPVLHSDDVLVVNVAHVLPLRRQYDLIAQSSFGK